MEKAVCSVSVAPIRAENSDRAEMVTQMLFGESCSVLDVQSNWTKIRMDFDGYEGWLDTKQITPISHEDLQRRKVNLVCETFTSAVFQNGKILLSMGAEVDFQTPVPQRSDNLRESIAIAAREFLNVPYLWGGRSFFGIDCSGFVQLVFKIHGIQLPRDAYQQAEAGTLLDFVGEARPGDLAFFENSDGRIIHIGIMLEEQKIIHAHGKVRIDMLDSTGIYNAELKKYTHRLRFLKRILY